jgi:hypothetical protein
MEPRTGAHADSSTPLRVHDSPEPVTRRECGLLLADMASAPASAIEAAHRAGDAEADWAAQLGKRVRGYPLLTLIGTSVFIFVFFLGYFYVQRYPLFAPIVMPMTSLDRLIPFQPLALAAYVSLWIYVGAGPGLQATRREMAIYALWMAALCVTGLAIFYLLPTQMADVNVGAADSVFFRTLQSVDAAGNACPSMHVAVAVFTVIRVDDVLRVVRCSRGSSTLACACSSAIRRSRSNSTSCSMCWRARCSARCSRDCRDWRGAGRKRRVMDVACGIIGSRTR